MRKSTLVATLGLSVIMLLAASQPAVAQLYAQHNAVSGGAVPADLVDPFLVNAWGLAASPTTPWWISDSETSHSTTDNVNTSAAPFMDKVPGNPTVVDGVYKDVAMLTLDRMVYCVGESWKLSIVSAAANSAIGLMGVSNGLPWEWPGFGTTDSEGKYSTGGTFADGSQGRHSLYVEIGGVKSNVVSFSVSDCK